MKLYCSTSVELYQGFLGLNEENYIAFVAFSQVIYAFIVKN